ncbi:MAG: hypothetical protein ACKVP0_07595 [Pirellulaceae bacterium]
MPASKWLKRAQAAFQKQGLPEHQQLRFMEELQDHLTDLQEANMSRNEPSDFEQTMGPPEPVAVAMAESYRRERFLARHLWLACVAFTVGPLAFHWLLALPLTCLTLVLLYCLKRVPQGEVPESLNSVLPIFFGVMTVLASVAVTAWFCCAARRNRLSWWMSLLGSAALTLGTLFLTASVMESQTALWVVPLATAAASLGTWYWAAWRGERWREEPVSMSRRYPIFVSGLGSIVAASSCLTGYLLLMALVVYLLVDVFGRPRNGGEFAILAFSCSYVPFAIAAGLCYRMTYRCPRKKLYSLLACVCVAAFAAMFTAGISGTPEGKSSMQFGISVGNAFHWGVFAQFLTPLAIWGALTLYAWRPLRLQTS